MDLSIQPKDNEFESKTILTRKKSPSRIFLRGTTRRRKNGFSSNYTGVRLQGDWGKKVALEGSKSPWEALRATKTLPSIFATFEKASTCAKRTKIRRNPVKIEPTHKGKILLKKSC